MKRLVATVVLMGLFVAIAGCTGSDQGGTVSVITDPTVILAGRDEVADALMVDVFEPAYAGLAAATDALAAAVESLCAQPDDPARLDAAQSAWRDAASAWAVTRSFRFGPVMELRASSDISFEVDPAKVAALIAGNDPVTPDAIARFGADQRTLTGAELVLFADEPIDGRRCEYLASTTSLVADAAREVAEAWIAGPEFEAQDVIDETVNGITFALAEIADMQLGKASGDVSGTPEFAEVDDGPAKGALDGMLDTLDGIDAVLSGGDGGSGINDLIADQSVEASERLATQLAEARAAIEAVPPPLADTADMAPVSAAYEAVQAPLTTMRTEVASLLGVTLTFGDADGDS